MSESKQFEDLENISFIDLDTLEKNTLGEIRKIIKNLDNYIKGTNEEIYNTEIFEQQMTKFNELLITLNKIIEKLKQNGENVEIYENITEFFNVDEYRKIYYEKINI
jgi:ABC-type amino acid transport substrate-binding protein